MYGNEEPGWLFRSICPKQRESRKLYNSMNSIQRLKAVQNVPTEWHFRTRSILFCKLVFSYICCPDVEKIIIGSSKLWLFWSFLWYWARKHIHSSSCFRRFRYSANFFKAILAMYMTVKCVFCGNSCSSTCCQSCHVASRTEKFSHLLGRFETASHSMSYHNDILALVDSSWQVGEKNHMNEYSSDHLVSQFGRTTSFCTGTIIRWCSSSVGSGCTIISEEG